MTDLALWLVETDTGEASLCLGRDAAEERSVVLMGSPDVLSVECTPLGTAGPVYGACGTEGCCRCMPLFGPDNVEIQATC